MNYRSFGRSGGRLRPFLLSFAASALLAGGAEAAEAPAQASASASSSTVDEVIVTAQKRSENAQRVPISIQTVTATTLARLGVKDVKDIEMAVPSVTFGDGSEQGRTGIRGIVDYSRNAGYDSRVGVYIDGVYLGRSYLNNQMLLGIQQIDVLRGPQGTLFGKDTDAGVISITTRKPTDQFTATGEVEAGNYGDYRVAGIVGGRIADDLDAQLALTKQGSSGYYHNILLNQYNQGTNDVAGRLQLRYHPIDKLDVNFSVDDSHQHNSTLHYTYVPTPGTDVYDFKSYNNDYAIVGSYGAAMTVDYQLGGGYKLTSITAYRGGDQFLDFNNETGPTNWVTPVFHEVTSQESEEFRIASPVTEHYDFVAGLYYFHQLNIENTKDVFGTAIGRFGYPYTLYENKSIPYGAHVETNSYAAFFNGNLRLTQQFEITAGLRYTDEQKTLSDFFAADPEGVLAGDFSGYGDKISTAQVTPKVGVNFHVLPTLLLFADTASGFKGGGWNVDNSTVSDLEAGIRFNPETVQSYEAGVKSDFLDHHARLNVTAFREDFKNFQVFTFVPVVVDNVSVNTSSLTNAGTVRSQGIEVEGALVPIDNLSLSANYTYDESNFVSYPGGGGKVGSTVLSANGAQTPYAPKNKAYLSVDYSHAVADGLMGSIHVGYAVQSSENFDPKHVNPVYGKYYDIPGYSTVDARIGISSEDKRWSVSVWSKNLGDARYIIFANRTALLSNPAIMYAPPRTFGVTLTTTF